MEIEVGKKYLLRNGSTVIIEVNDETNIRCFGGTIKKPDGKIDRAAFFTYRGFYNPEKGENERDIIRVFNQEPTN